MMQSERWCVLFCVCVWVCVWESVCVAKNEVTGLTDCVVVQSVLSVCVLTDVGQSSYIRTDAWTGSQPAKHTHTHKTTQPHTHTKPGRQPGKKEVANPAAHRHQHTGTVGGSWTWKHTPVLMGTRALLHWSSRFNSCWCAKKIWMNSRVHTCLPTARPHTHTHRYITADGWSPRMIYWVCLILCKCPFVHWDRRRAGQNVIKVEKMHVSTDCFWPAS